MVLMLTDFDIFPLPRVPYMFIMDDVAVYFISSDKMVVKPV